MEHIQRTIADFIGDRPAPLVELGTSVAICVETMKISGQSCVLVVERDSLRGIFTGRDFLARVIGAGREPGATLVDEVMTPDPERLAPTDRISYAINRMAIGGFRNLPIVVGERPVGLLAIRDVINHLAHVFIELEAIDADDSEESMGEWFDTGGGG